MPTYSEIAQMIYRDKVDLHRLRLDFMQQLHAHTGRPVIVYAANSHSSCASTLVSDDDMRAFMDTVRGIKGPALDLILHSNGGSPDAADMIVAYLREKFDHIRVIVPQQAMSAATMIACGANQLVLARHSFLGPIDLQLQVADGSVVAAQEVLDQYQLIRSEIKDPTEFWSGAGERYFPTLLVNCQNALAYGRELVERHLREVMFAGRNAKLAAEIANDLGNHAKHKNHGRRLSRKYLRHLGLTIVDLESDQMAQELVLSIHHCVMHTLAFVPALSKMVQNHLGKVVVTFSPATMAKLREKGFEVDAYKMESTFFPVAAPAEDDDYEGGEDDEDGEDADEAAEPIIAPTTLNPNAGSSVEEKASVKEPGA